MSADRVPLTEHGGVTPGTALVLIVLALIVTATWLGLRALARRKRHTS
jgi:hypothetical protein